MRLSRPAPSPWIAAVSLLFIGGVLLLATPTAHAQWKWKDGRGQVHVSDLPPPRDVAEKDILQRPTAAKRTVVAAPGAAASASATAASAASQKAGPLDGEIEKRRKAAEQEQNTKTKADEEQLAAQRRENCSRARSHATALESGQRIARTNDKGEREVLDDKARADEMRRTREVITSDCR